MSEQLHPLPDALALMPPLAPLAMPAQDLSHPPVGATGDCARLDDAVMGTRRAVFALAIVLAAGLGLVQALWLGAEGLTLGESALIGAVVASLVWTLLTVITAVLGFLPHRQQAVPGNGPAMRVAVLVTVHEEELTRVERNLAALLADLGARPCRHAVKVFVLSDTQGIEHSIGELGMIARLRARAPGLLFYRRRNERSGHKAGNIADWVQGWGGAHDAMVVLDADSVMDVRAITRLVDTLAADASLGIVQSWPQIIAAPSLMGRMQAIGTQLYGALTARGYARWSGASANYWGHNAAIRVSAFAAQCGLAQGYLSHDSVEAMAMRRAGWGVVFLPDELASFEEVPPDLAAFLKRDRRWCAGNLQHAPLMVAPGLPLMVRFNLLYGVASYLSAPLWLGMLVYWAANPFPVIDGNGWAPLALAAVYATLLAPKLMGIAAGLLRLPSGSGLPAGFRVLADGLSETLWSVLIAPIVMVQRSLAVAMALLGRRPRWTAQRRDAAASPWGYLLRLHAAETMLGAAILAGIASDLASPWLLPVAVSLVLAVPLSRLSAWSPALWGGDQPSIRASSSDGRISGVSVPDSR